MSEIECVEALSGEAARVVEAKLRSLEPCWIKCLAAQAGAGEGGGGGQKVGSSLTLLQSKLIR